MSCGEKLSRKQEQAIAALLTDPTIAGAAGEVGISERTLRRWLQLPSFAREYRAARRKLVEDATSLLQRAAQMGAARMVALVRSANEWVALTASRAVLEAAVHATELTDLLAEIQDLKDRMTELERERKASAKRTAGAAGSNGSAGNGRTG